MDLAELKFVVDTKDLEDAAKKVADLGTEVSKLNKPMQELTRESAKTNKELSKTEEAAAKAALAQLKLEEAQNKSTQSTSKSISVLERQNLILEYMAQGNSKGQASILATAKAAGALDDEMIQLNNTLVTQRTLIGGDPFDKSIGLMQKLQNEYKITTEVTNLFNKNLGLTEKQMTDLAREKERLIALYGIEGKSLNGLSSEYEQLIQKSVKLNQANDARTRSMKDQIRAQNDAAKANTYIANELERVNRLNSESADITSATNNKLIRFERELKASGMSAAEAAAKLEAYKNSLLSTQKAAGNRQVDYLSRALGPQITDIAVGLATGQAPLTILLQQGGQLRDQFALAGVAGADMGKMLIQASKSMVSSVKDVGMAIGQVLVGAITGTGKAITNFGMQITGTSTLLDIFNAKLIATAGANSLLVKSFAMLGIAINVLTGTIVLAAIAAFVMYLVSINNVIKEENALNRALNLTGAALGLNVNMAYDAARSMQQFGVSTGSALTVLTEMAKIGGLSSSSLQMIATTASALKTAFDIPISETVKKFKELQEKPTESLTKLAAQLGTIPLEILKQVDAYERAGKSIQAAELAMKTYEEAGKKAASRTIEEFGAITKLGIEIGKIWNSTWESIMGFGRRATPTDELKKAYENLSFLRNQRGADNENSDVGRRIAATVGLIDELEMQLAAQKELKDLEAKNAADAAKFADEKKKRDEAAKKAKEEATKLEQSYQQILQQASGFLLNQTGAVENLTKAEIALAQVRNSKEFKALGTEQQNRIAKIYEEAKAIEILNRTYNERKRDTAFVSDLEGRGNRMGDEYANRMRRLDDAVLAGNVEAVEEYARLSNIIYRTSESYKAMESAAIAANAAIAQSGAEAELVRRQYDLDFKREPEKAAIEALSKFRNSTLRADIEYERNVADARRRMNSADAAKVIEVYKEQAEAKKALAQEVFDREKYLLSESYKLNKALADSFQNIVNGISGAIITGLFEGGKQGSKQFRALLEAELKRPITVIVKALIETGVSSLVGGGSKGGSFAESIVGSFLKKQIGGIAVGGTTLGAAAGAFGQGVLSGFSMGAPVASMGSATSASFNAGAAAAPVAGAAAGLAANKIISQDYQINKTITDLQNVATVAAAFIPGLGPLVALGVGVVSGLANRAFGMKAKEITGEGIVGTLTTQGADVKAFEEWFQKGGWFRSNKSGRSYSAISSSLQEYLNLSLSGLTASTKAYAAVLGLEAKDIDSVTKSINLNLKGLSAEDRQKKIDEALSGFGNELAKKLGFESFDALQKLGEEVLKERYALETQILELQGNTVALRAREREQIYETNRGLYDQINAIKDKQKADEEAAKAMEKLTSVTTTIVDEINRLRGVNTSQSGLESQFAILTAQARSGDLNALAQLPEITKGLEQIAASTAVNATDIIFARARLAQSLQDTLGYTGGFTASATTSVASIGSVSTSGAAVTSNVSSASSNQELLAALVTEIQGLRAEVRADVSHNAKTAKILERVNQDGESLTITTLV